jgi:hypothetical protein
MRPVGSIGAAKTLVSRQVRAGELKYHCIASALS